MIRTAYGIPVRDGVGAGAAGKFFRRRRRRRRRRRHPVGPQKIICCNISRFKIYQYYNLEM